MSPYALWWLEMEAFTFALPSAAWACSGSRPRYCRLKQQIIYSKSQRAKITICRLLLTDKNVVKDGLTVCAQVHASKQHDLVLVRNNFVSPPGSWNVTVDGDGSPSVQLAIVNV